MVCDRNFKVVESDVMSEINFCAFINDFMYVLEEHMRGGSEYCQKNIFNT